jgi:hypothetical protein
MNRGAVDFVRTARPMDRFCASCGRNMILTQKLRNVLRSELWSGGRLAKTLPGPLRSSYWSEKPRQFECRSRMAGRIPITINRGTSERRIFAKTIAITGRLLLRDRQLKRFFDLMNLKKGLVVETRAVLFGGGPVLPGWTARTRCDSLRREQLSLHWVFRLR